MAEAILSQISGDFLECTICLEPFKEPKVLPCLHTFCKGCLEKFVEKQGEVKDKFPCPTCRTETVLPGGGVAGLKNNFFVLSLRDTVDAHKSLVSKEDDKVYCENCEEHVAKHGCIVCEEFLCDECTRGHRRGKSTRDHKVIGVAELKEQLITKTSSVKSRKLPICPKHKDEKLKFYCETCQHPICRDCTVLQHKDHKYNLLADVVSDVRAKMKNKVAAAMPKIEEYQAVTSVAAKKQAELDTRSKKAADDIDAAAEEEIKYYSGLVRRKQTELKEKLAAITAARSKQLSATTDGVESTLGCLSSTVDFSQKVVEHGSDFDVMSVYSDVAARLESLLKGPTPDIPDDISYVRFHLKKERKEMEIILGEIVAEKTRKMRCKAHYSYAPENTDELRLEVGDVIEILKQEEQYPKYSSEEEGWWEGSLNGKSGVFPSNFVEVIKEEDKENIEEQQKEKTVAVRVEFDYEAELDDELTLKIGDIVTNAKQQDGGWWEGELNGKKGVFPDNFVKVIKFPPAKPSDKTNSHDKDEGGKVAKLASRLSMRGVPLAGMAPPGEEGVTRRPSKPVEKAKVLFDYNAENEDELTLKVGEVIIIRSKESVDSGWWEGEVGGRTGVFPDIFVELLPPEENPWPPSAAVKPVGAPLP